MEDKLEKYNKLVSQGYKTLNEILEENDISRSQIKSIRKYTDFLDKESAYYPKARKEVNFYSKETVQKIKEFSNLSKGDKCKKINLLTYGVESTSQLEEKRKLLSEVNKANSTERTIKRNKTNMERYGTCDFINSDKAKKTIIENYGSIEDYNIERGLKRKESNKLKFEIFCKDNDLVPLSELINLHEKSLGYENKQFEYEICELITEMNIPIIIYYDKNCIKCNDYKKLYSIIKEKYHI